MLLYGRIEETDKYIPRAVRVVPEPDAQPESSRAPKALPAAKSQPLKAPEPPEDVQFLTRQASQTTNKQSDAQKIAPPTFNLQQIGEGQRQIASRKIAISKPLRDNIQNRAEVFEICK
ncbi:hypothetical protein H2200_009843 [Cladophialophora chaetospira]|uniref:Uncharacterized protein n=1 Tax=Cladophialophora chaetospira TaxID=386627 RepID=A0AA38X398_9EURO|nr:hypothetical protein H2200_009843 [Cladophialophora chaetospira]